MIPERARGLVLRTRPLTETSLIVHWLTAESGRVATVAKGGRRPKSPFRGQIDSFYLADFTFQRSARSELHTLREVKLIESFSVLRQDLDRLRQAAYCASLIEQTTEIETPLPEVYETFVGLLRELPRREALPQTVFAFEMKLLAESGLAPNLSETALTPGSRLLLEKFASAEWADIFRLRLSAAQIGEIRQYLHGFLIFHLGGIPRSRATACAVGKGAGA
jgi:DNA repair protein RecO (recombination protein O)